jgi:hypothetical protein
MMICDDYAIRGWATENETKRDTDTTYELRLCFEILAMFMKRLLLQLLLFFLVFVWAVLVTIYLAGAGQPRIQDSLLAGTLRGY